MRSGGCGLTVRRFAAPAARSDALPVRRPPLARKEGTMHKLGRLVTLGTVAVVGLLFAPPAVMQQVAPVRGGKIYGQTSKLLSLNLVSFDVRPKPLHSAPEPRGK